MSGTGGTTSGTSGTATTDGTTVATGRTTDDSGDGMADGATGGTAGVAMLVGGSREGGLGGMGSVGALVAGSREGDFEGAGEIGFDDGTGKLELSLLGEAVSFGVTAEAGAVVGAGDGEWPVGDVVPRSSSIVPGRALASCCSLSMLGINHCKRRQE